MGTVFARCRKSPPPPPPPSTNHRRGNDDFGAYRDCLANAYPDDKVPIRYADPRWVFPVKVFAYPQHSSESVLKSIPADAVKLARACEFGNIRCRHPGSAECHFSWARSTISRRYGITHECEVTGLTMGIRASSVREALEPLFEERNRFYNIDLPATYAAVTNILCDMSPHLPPELIELVRSYIDRNYRPQTRGSYRPLTLADFRKS